MSGQGTGDITIVDGVNDEATLKKMAEDAKLINDMCVFEDVDFAFNQSKEIMVDELTNLKTLKLYLLFLCLNRFTG